MRRGLALRLGMILPWNEPDGSELRGSSIAEGAARLEDVGFDSVWVFDAIARGFIVPDPLTAVAVAASATRRIEVGTCILQLVIRNPVDLAHRIMTTHLIAGDRLSLGVGAGSAEDDFRAFGADFATRLKVFPERLETIRALLRGERVGDADLTPWAATMGGPRILIGSWGNRTWIERTTNEFDGWISSAAKGGKLEEGVTAFRELGGERAIVTNVHVDLDFGPDEDTEFPFSLRCSPEDAASKLRWLADIGYSDVILRTKDHSRENLERIRSLWPGA